METIHNEWINKTASIFVQCGFAA